MRLSVLDIGDKGDAEVDEYTLRDLADTHLHDRAFRAKDGREDRDEDVGID